MSMNRRQLVESIRTLQRQQAQESAATVARFAHIQSDIRHHVRGFTETGRQLTATVGQLSESVEKMGAEVDHLGETLQRHAQSQDESMLVLMSNLEAHVNWVEADKDELRGRLDLLTARVRRLEEGNSPAA